MSNGTSFLKTIDRKSDIGLTALFNKIESKKVVAKELLQSQQVEILFEDLPLLKLDLKISDPLQKELDLVKAELNSLKKVIEDMRNQIPSRMYLVKADHMLWEVHCKGTIGKNLNEYHTYRLIHPAIFQVTFNQNWDCTSISDSNDSTDVYGYKELLKQKLTNLVKEGKIICYY